MELKTKPVPVISISDIILLLQNHANQMHQSQNTLENNIAANQKVQYEHSTEKGKLYLDKWERVYDVFSVAMQSIAVVEPSGLFTVAAQAFEKASKTNQSKNNSKQEHHQQHVGVTQHYTQILTNGVQRAVEEQRNAVETARRIAEQISQTMQAAVRK
jgi:hypothetical protein